MKKILNNLEARKALQFGVDRCADVVKVSLGGNGRNVAIFNGIKTEIINDGVSIVRAVDVKEPEYQAGVQLAKQCANQTNLDAGDGTTTTIVLLQAFLKEIITDFETVSPRKKRDELLAATDKLFSHITPTEIKTKEEMYNVALTASLNEEVAEILADGFEKLGKNGRVVIEEVNKDEVKSEIVNGLQFESKIATDNILASLSEEKETIEDVYVYAVDKVENLAQIQAKLAEIEAEQNGKMVIISNVFDRQVLLSFLKTSDFKFYAVENKELTSFDDIKEYANKKMKVVITREHTTLIGGSVSKEYLEAIKKKDDSEFEKEIIETRLARLTSGVLNIKVGGKTEAAREELYLKVEDASNALKKALVSGYVRGGGIALSQATAFLGDEGAEGIIKKVAQVPYQQIQMNSGNEEIPAEVIDSFQTVKSSFYNALSTATSVLTVDAAIIEEPDEE